MRVRINPVFLLSHSLFKEPSHGKLFPSQQTCSTRPYLPASMTDGKSPAVCICFFFLHLFSPFRISQSKNSGITGMWQDWISAGWLDCLLLYLRLHLVAKALDVYKKKKRRWLMPPPYVWTALSWPQQKAAKGKKKKKSQRLIYWPGGKSRREDECHSAPTTDRCKVLQLLFCLSFDFAFPSHDVWKESASYRNYDG